MKQKNYQKTLPEVHGLRENEKTNKTTLQEVNTKRP